MNFVDQVLYEVKNAIEIPDDLQEFLSLLLQREQQNTFKEPHRDLYAYALIHWLKQPGKFHSSGFSVPLGLLVDREIPEKLKTLYFNPSTDFKNDLFRYHVPVRFPQRLRREHTYILGNTGSGKTQLIQQLISYDLETNASIIVIDSQNDLINTLKRSKLIDPERLVVIDPRDSVEYPLALNMFDMGLLDSEMSNPRTIEEYINTTTALLNFVISSVLDFELTPTQQLPFNYCIRLLLLVPNATLLTFLRILEEGLSEDHWTYVDRLSQSARNFFKNSFDSGKYRKTRQEIATRLHLILSTPSLGRIFSSPHNKLDLGSEMDRGKVILISTDRGFLQADGCAFFGRYFISLIAQAMMRRAERPPQTRRKTYVYIDEVHEYLSTTEEMLSNFFHQGRKFNIGLTVAHQELYQLTPDLFHAIKTNSAIKMVGTCSHSDSNALKYDMGVDQIDAHRLSFLTKLRGSQAFFVGVNAGFLERMEQRTDDELEAIMVMNRAKYSIRSADPSMMDKSENQTEKIDETKGIPKDPLSDYT